MATTQTDTWREVFERVEEYISHGQYPPHSFCLTYNDRLIDFMLVGDATMSLAYVIIGLVLLFKADTLSDGVKLVRWGIYLFSAFILMCGVDHALSVFNLFSGAYWIEAYWGLITGLVSILSASMVCLSLGGLNEHNAGDNDHRADAG